MEVVAIADIRSRSAPTEEAESAGLPVLCGVTIEGTTGKLRVSSITITAEGRRHVFACDAVLMAGGFTPSVHLFSQSRGKLAWDADLQAFLPRQSAEADRSPGACRGRFALDVALSARMYSGRAAARGAAVSPQTPNRTA